MLTPEQRKLCEDNMHLVDFFMYRHRNCGIEHDELFSLVQLAMVKAARTYDSEHGYAFSTHVGWRVRGYITHVLAYRNRLMRKQEPLRLDAPVVGNLRLMDIEPSRDLSPEDDLEQRELFQRTRAHWRRLTLREQQALTLRFGLDDDEARTFEKVAACMGVTAWRANVLVQNGLHKLRNAIERESRVPI
ncbi:MAG: sigma-70 family RNA polymerase sigma factor [Oscillospiraceae bacterium]|nr:sigma-70 family RNA polymerase sigma factor [Oscillospiraceae bacterium]